jgi:SnoaL-like domain
VCRVPCRCNLGVTLLGSRGLARVDATRHPRNMTRLATQDVEQWIKKYEHAWRTGASADIEALFTESAEYHEWPYETAWIGRQEIVNGWLSREKWQAGGWTFDWSILTINGDTAAVEGTGVYTELGSFANLWVLTFADDGRCAVFRMWNNEIDG